MYICTTGGSPLTRNEVNSVLNTPYFYLNSLVSTMADGELRSISGSPSQAKASFVNGRTLVVAGLENYNEKVSLYSRSLGLGTKVTMFLSPQKGAEKSFQVSNGDIHVRRVMGDQSFLIRRSHIELPYDLHDDFSVRIEKGESWRPVTGEMSCYLLFEVGDQSEPSGPDFI